MIRRVTATALLALTLAAGFGATAATTQTFTASGNDACPPDIPNCVPPNPFPGPWEWD